MLSDITATVNSFCSTFWSECSIWDSKLRKHLAYWTVRWECLFSIRPVSFFPLNSSKPVSTGIDFFHAICLFFLFVVSSKCLGFFFKKKKKGGKNVLFCYLHKPLQLQHHGLCRADLAGVHIFKGFFFFFFLHLFNSCQVWKSLKSMCQ